MYLLKKIPANQQSAFESRVSEIVSNLGMTDPKAGDYLMALMDLESGLNPSIANKIGCVGLIQFCPDAPGGTDKTIGGKKVSLAYLKTLSAVEQLDYVEQYLADTIRMVGYTPQSFVDLQLLLFLPAAEKFDYEEPIFIKSTAFMDSVKKNNPLYVDGNGNITKKSIEAVYKKRYAGIFEAVKEIASEAVGKTQEIVVKTGSIIIENRIPFIVGGLLLVVGSLALLYYSKNKIYGK